MTAEPIAPPQESLLCTTLKHLRSASGEGVVIALTSANPGEGVTHSVSALPASLRENGATRILRVGARDLRAANCSPASLFRCYKPVGEGLFDFSTAPTSSSPANPRRVWAHDWKYRRDCIAQLRSSFDYIFIDCPAIASSDDALVLAPLVDAVVTVVEADKTTVDEVRQLEHSIELAGGKLVGHILNKQRRSLPGWLEKAFN